MEGAVAVPAIMDKRPRLGPPRSFAFPLPRSLRLKNGMRVLLSEKRDLPLVQVRLQLPLGTLDDPDGHVGLAYLTGRLLVEGAGKYSALQFSSALQDIGASIASWSDEDATFVSLKVLRRHLERGLDLLADVVLRPRFTKTDFNRVMSVLKNRAIQRRDQPAQISHLALKWALFGDHPHGRPLLPEPRDLVGTTVAQLKAFHQQRYRPDQAVVVAAGDVDGDELVRMLEQRFGGWTASAAQTSSRARPLPRSKGPRLVLLHRPGASQSVIKVGHRSVARGSDAFAAIQLLNTMLGGSFTSRLNQNLREKHGFTYGVHSSFFLYRRVGVFNIRTSVENKNTAAALEQILLELQRMVRRPPSKRELDKARRLLLADQPSQAETVGGLVEAYSDLLACHVPLTRLKTYPEQLNAVDPAAIQSTAVAQIRPDDLTIVISGDMDVYRAELEKLYGPALVWTPDRLGTAR